MLTSATGNLATMIFSLSEEKENPSKYLGVETSFNFTLNGGPKLVTTFGFSCLLFVK